MTFTVHGHLPGLNELINADRAHWAIGAKLKKQAQERVITALTARQAETGERLRPVERPVNIRIEWHEPNRRRDFDNITGGGTKVILDALVAAGILPNDGERWVKGITHQRHADKSNPRVVVEIEEVSNG
jgi:Holliday junction resolvase RusA-like endonuclease